jgi:hypothetical protein
MRSPYLLDNTGHFWIIRDSWDDPWHWYSIVDNYRSRYNQSNSHWHTRLCSSALSKIAPGLYTDQYWAVDRLFLESQRIKDIKRLLQAYRKHGDPSLFEQILGSFQVDDPEALLQACQTPERGDAEQLTRIASILHLKDSDQLVQVASTLERGGTDQDSKSLEMTGSYEGNPIRSGLSGDSPSHSEVQTETNSLYRQVISILDLYSLDLFIKSTDILNIKCNEELLLKAACILEIDSCDIFRQIGLTNQVSEVASFLDIDSSCLLAMVRAFTPIYHLPRSATLRDLASLGRRIQSGGTSLLPFDILQDYSIVFYCGRESVNDVTNEIPSWYDDDCLLLLYIAGNFSVLDPGLLKRLACILGIVDVGRYLHVAQRLGIPFQALRVHTIQQEGDGSAFYNKYKLLLTSYAKELGIIPTDAEAAINLILYRLLNTSGTGRISDAPVRSLQGLDHKGTLRRLKRQLIRLSSVLRRKRILIIHILIKARQKADVPTLKNKHIAYRARSNISYCRKIRQNQALTNRTATGEDHSLLTIVMLPGYSTCTQFLLATDDVVALTRRSGT